MTKLLPFLALAIALFAFGLPGTALATAGGSGAGGQDKCSSSGNGGQEAVITTVTQCVQEAITEATEKYLSEFSDYMKPIITAFMILVVTFFGVDLLWSNDSMDNRKQKAFTLLFKLGAVALFAYNFGGIAMNAFEGSKQLQDTIVQALPHDSKCQSQGQQGGGGGGQYISSSGQQVWGALDCLLGRLMGYGAKMGLSSSILGLLTSVFASGAMGVSVGFIGVICLLAFLFFVLRVVYIFLTSYMFIGFLLIISPLTVPTMLHPATARVFDSWWKSLATAIAMPGIVFAYLCVAMPLIDKVVGNGQEQSQGNEDQNYKNMSLSSILGDEKTVEGYQRNPQQLFGLANRSFNKDFLKNRSDITEEDAYEKGNSKDITNPMGSGATDLGSSFNLPRFDAGQNTMGKLWHMGYSMIRILIVAMMLTSLMGAIPEITSAIFQAGSALAIAATGEMPLESRVKTGVAGIAQKMTGIKSGG